jgi:phage terminase large subunit-like protein
MYCLLADGEPQAEVYAGASMKSQAMVIFRSAVQMWRQSPALSARLTPSGGNPIWSLADLKTGSFFRPISTDEAHSGPMPSCALLDEIHEHRDGHMIEMMERGFKSRRQPLLVMITNSGSDRLSACWTEHLHAIRVAAGTMDVDDEATYVGEVIDDTTFSFCCSLDKDDDPLEDEGCWVKSNPLLDVSMPSEELRRAVSQAKAIPGKLNNILRLHFCVWTSAETAWMARPTLEAVIVPPEFPDDGQRSLKAFTAPHQGKEVSVGIDLSATQDLTAMSFVVHTGWVEVERTSPEGRARTMRAPTFDMWIEAWTPADTIAERSIRDSAHYDVWARQGWLHAPPGPQIRLDFVAAHLADAATIFRITKTAYDRYAFRHFEEELSRFNFKSLLIEHPQGGKQRGAIPIELAQEAKRTRQEMPQGLWMPGSVMEFESLIFEKRIRIFGNPVTISALMATAVEVDPRTNYRWFSKQRATGRIDPAVAGAIGIGAATMQAPKKTDVNDFLRNAVVA